MRILRSANKGYQKKLLGLNRRYGPTRGVRDVVAQIFLDVAKEGDRALLQYSEKFGGPRLNPSQRRVSDNQIEAALVLLIARPAEPSSPPAITWQLLVS